MASAHNAAYPELEALEADIDARLSAMAGRPFCKQRRDELAEIGAQHAALAWASKAASEPIEPTRAERRWAEALVPHPVFILGAHRSGTTLVRNLLDGHPALSVVPSEGNLLTNYYRPLRRKPLAERAAVLARIWIGRFVLSDNVPPFWLLGRSDPRRSPYVELARRVRAWIRSPAVIGLGEPYDAFVAVVLAFTELAHPRAQLESIRYWAEKTPLHELHLKLSLRRFPEARCVHVIRDPRASLVSRRILGAGTGETPRDVGRHARLIARSLKLAARNRQRLGPARYHVLRYEDLVTAPRDTLSRLCEFLGIDDDAALHRPTVTGRPTQANSAYARSSAADALSPDSLDAFRTRITERESALIRRAAGRVAATLGYDLDR